MVETTGKVGRWFFCAVFLCAVLLWCGCRTPNKHGKFSKEELEVIPQIGRQELPSPSGGVVLSVNNEVITSDEILGTLEDRVSPYARGSDPEVFQKRMRPVFGRVVIDKISDILIYQKAIKDAPDNIDEMLDNAVENEINRFVVRYEGNMAKAQEALKQRGMDWESFREYQKKMMMIQSYVSKEMMQEGVISHSEMIAFYDAKKKELFEREGFYRFSLIDIVPGKLEETGEGSAVEAAVDKAEELIVQLGMGADFGELAKEESHGHRAIKGGAWDKVTPDSLAEPYDVLEREAAKMQVGDISSPIEAAGHVFIVRLDEKEEAVHKPFEEVQDQIEEEIQYRRRRVQYEEMVEKLVRQANIEDMDRFVSFCIETAYRRWSVK